MSKLIKLSFIAASLTVSVWFLAQASDPGIGDWPMWGGTPDRNMVSNQKVVTSWDVKTGKNVKWVSQLGSQSYGNPVVADGQVYVGTNNELVRDPMEGGDRGVLMAFRESDGQFLWQHTNIKVAAGRANDWPFQGVCSSPLVEGKTLWYVTNRWRDCVAGYARRREAREDQLEVRHDGRGRVAAAQHVEFVAGELWRPDLRQHVERQDESHVHIPSPKAPSIIAVNKKQPASWCGKTTRWKTVSCTANGRRHRSEKSAMWCRW